MTTPKKRNPQEEMARGTRKPAGARAVPERKAWEVEFVNVELSAQDKALLREQVPSGEDLVAFIVRTTEAGFKVTLSWDNAHDCAIASMTGKDTALEENRGKCMTARGKEAGMALTALAYKWEVLCGGEIFGFMARTVDDDKLG